VEGSLGRDLQGSTASEVGVRGHEGESPARNGQGDSGSVRREESTAAEQKSFVHDIFCGKTVTHTRCMNCEAQSKREENFMELTLDVEQQDTTLEQCMLAFRCNRLQLNASLQLFMLTCNDLPSFRPLTRSICCIAACVL
jgi:hypothetical protein